jgi:hypothetical protein
MDIHKIGEGTALQAFSLVRECNNRKWNRAFLPHSGCCQCLEMGMHTRIPWSPREVDTRGMAQATLFPSWQLRKPHTRCGAHARFLSWPLENLACSLPGTRIFSQPAAGDNDAGSQWHAQTQFGSHTCNVLGLCPRADGGPRADWGSRLWVTESQVVSPEDGSSCFLRNGSPASEVWKFCSRGPDSQDT